MADPLKLLQDVFSGVETAEFISEDSKEPVLHFKESNIKVPVSHKTAWKKKDKGGYSIGALWFILESKDLSVGEYMKKAGNLGIEKVHIMEKKKIVDHFTNGKGADNPLVDIGLIESTLISIDRERKRDAKAAEKDAEARQRRPERSMHEQMMDWLD